MGTLHDEMVDREIKLNAGLDPEESDDAYTILLILREEISEKGYLDSSFSADIILDALSWIDTWKGSYDHEVYNK